MAGITPGSTFVYDRLGRPDTTTQVGGHSWAYTYDATTLRPDTETITYNTGAGTLTRVIDRSFDSLLRPSGWQLKNGATIEYDFSRTYESAASRPESLTGSGPFFSGAGPSFTYSYVPAAPRLVEGFASGSTVSTFNAWEPNRDVLDYKQNTFGGSLISKYDYTVNDMSRRSAVAETGSAYAGSPSVGWGYNSRGEVTLHDHTTAAYDSVYEFDTIGNRTKAAAGTTLPGSPNHASNNLNQYTTIGGVSPGYDDDGNLTSDAGGNTHGSARTYQWNAENQLRQVSSGAVADYRYDPHGRRISKTAGGVTTWFLYDGWNLVAEYQSGALTRTHLWGLDLSGTTQGAGGVGGLLCTSIGGTKYYPLYDGNGNICQYLDGSGGLAAHYEYGPFGHLLNSPGTGSTPALFNFRFSTKYNDSETDFYYYGYRYYSSWMGRWINRDPLAEQGGINLMAFSANNPTKFVDKDGRIPFESGSWYRTIDDDTIAYGLWADTSECHEDCHTCDGKVFVFMTYNAYIPAHGRNHSTTMSVMNDPATNTDITLIDDNTGASKPSELEIVPLSGERWAIGKSWIIGTIPCSGGKIKGHANVSFGSFIHLKQVVHSYNYMIKVSSCGKIDYMMTIPRRDAFRQSDEGSQLPFKGPGQGYELFETQ